jgi:hypothetical protein
VFLRLLCKKQLKRRGFTGWNASHIPDVVGATLILMMRSETFQIEIDLYPLLERIASAMESFSFLFGMYMNKDGGVDVQCWCDIHMAGCL